MARLFIDSFRNQQEGEGSLKDARKNTNVQVAPNQLVDSMNEAFYLVTRFPKQTGRGRQTINRLNTWKVRLGFFGEVHRSFWFGRMFRRIGSPKQWGDRCRLSSGDRGKTLALSDGTGDFCPGVCGFFLGRCLVWISHVPFC